MKNIIEIVFKYVTNNQDIRIKMKDGKPTGGVTFKSLDLAGLLEDEDYIQAIVDVKHTIRHGYKGDEFSYTNEKGYRVKDNLKSDFFYIGPDNRKSYNTADDIMNAVQGK